MRTAKVLQAITVALLPLVSFGCTQTDKTAELEKAKVLKNGMVVTSEQLTNFDGLSEKIKSEKIPDQTVICVVGDDAINVGDYKVNFRYRSDQAKQELLGNSRLQQVLLNQAKKSAIKLTEREQNELISSATKEGGAKLQEDIKAGKVNQVDFEKSVLEMGLILKYVHAQIEERLLTDMINSSLLLDAARKSGFAKRAFNKYVELKHSDKIKQYLAITKLTPNQVKDRILEDVLIEMMKAEIIKTADIPDKEIYKIYAANKENFHHNGRSNWSQIVIKDPERDMGVFTSIASDVDRKFPKASQKEKAARVAAEKEKQKQKALNIIKQARVGLDFEFLANSNTDDIPARASKTGGKMGWADLETLSNNKLLGEVAKSLKAMKPGQVYPKPIRTMTGWHIIKLNEKQGPGYIEFDEVKDELKRTMANQNQAMTIKAWLIRKRETVPVRVSKEFASFFAKANNIGDNQLKNEDKMKSPEQKSEPENKPAKTDSSKEKTNK